MLIQDILARIHDVENKQRETVLFGGKGFMHAAHPLIAAGARQTFYQRDPWKRLIRTISLQNQ